MYSIALDWDAFRQSVGYFTRALRTLFHSRHALIMENIALRSQLAIYQQQVLSGKRSKPLPTPAFRVLWVWLSKCWPDWRSALMVVKPETVIRWHRAAFKWHWRRKSQRRGRPAISATTIAAVKRIHRENPLWSPERIHDQLADLGLTDIPAPNSIAKYLPGCRKPPSEKQRLSWRTFLVNHRHEIWSMDFCVVPTINFKVLYILVIVGHQRRQIRHIAVTAHPTAGWVVQQLRNATPFGEQPKYLIHDREAVFVGHEVQRFLGNADITSKRTAYHSPWQNGVTERTIGILRRELLDHVIPLNERHLQKLLTEYVNRYYNPVRTHQANDRQAPLLQDSPPRPGDLATLLEPEPILGGLYHTYRRAA